jgi:hypothetical protein
MQKTESSISRNCYMLINPKLHSGAKMRIRALILLGLIATSLLCAGSYSEVSGQENVRVLSSTIYQTYGYAPFSVSKGDYLVAGEVENLGSETQKFNLTATFYDASGTILGASYLTDSLPDAPACYLHVLLPNQKSPFLLWFSRFDAQGNFRVVDHYDLVLTASPAGTYYPSLVIVSNSSHEVDSTLYVEGNVKNIGPTSMEGLSVYVTYYKASGDVLAVSAEGGRGLAPNETGPFSVSLNGFNQGGRLEEIYRYDVTAEGYDNSLWTADGQLINPEVVYVLGTPEETVVPVQPDSFPYLFYVVAIVLVLVIVVVSVLFLRKSQKHAVVK